MSRVTVVVGGQYGSEGKGGVAGYLHRVRKYDYGVRIGGPNAGHTVVDHAGRAYPLRQIPVAAVVDPDCMLVIASGSEVDLKVLEGEFRLLEADGHALDGRLWLDAEATVIEDHHKEQESVMAHGSTQKGIGAARASRAMRRATLAWQWRGTGREIGDGVRLEDILKRGASRMLADAVVGHSRSALIEGTQGYALGSHAGHYPHCTSGDCKVTDFLSQAGIPATPLLEPWVCLRTYPIRIAGNSGWMYEETSWEDVGQKPEYTTVTKKMRRVGEWDMELARESVLMNGGHAVKVALTFADYWWPGIAGMSGNLADTPGIGTALSESIQARVHEIENKIGALVYLLGTGPDTYIVNRNLNTGQEV